MYNNKLDVKHYNIIIKLNNYHVPNNNNNIFS